jgi:imidazole glycerol-phosphate synthase
VGHKGIGVLDTVVQRFDASDKVVPHIGWNQPTTLVGENESLPFRDSHFYFVHSYRVGIPDHEHLPSWAHSTARYGNEYFISSVRMGNVFATQFHPEKSGEAGLRLLDSWVSLERTLPRPLVLEDARRMKPPKGSGLTKRIIACLDVRANDQGDLVVTKGDQYDVRDRTNITANVAGAVRNLGKPVDLACRYFTEGADEICFLNITSFRHSPLKDQPMLAVVKAAAETVFVPLTIGGGIKDTVDPDGTPHTALEVAGEYFRAGADKVSIGSEAVFIAEKSLSGQDVSENAISSIALVYGSQAVVVSIDPRRVLVDPTDPSITRKGLVHGKGQEDGKTWWYQCTVHGGREARPLSVVELAEEVEKLGAGEILLNSIDRDGTGLGFDLDLINLVCNAVSIPVIASSGAGTSSHFLEVFQDTGVEAALAAGIFHRRTVNIAEIKELLSGTSVPVRTLAPSSTFLQ